MHTATWEGSLGIVELLLEAGQDPDTPDERGLTPIMVALLRYNVVVMRCVFRNGQAVRRNIVEDVSVLLRLGKLSPEGMGLTICVALCVAVLFYYSVGRRTANSCDT